MKTLKEKKQDFEIMTALSCILRGIVVMSEDDCSICEVNSFIGYVMDLYNIDEFSETDAYIIESMLMHEYAE